MTGTVAAALIPRPIPPVPPPITPAPTPVPTPVPVLLDIPALVEDVYAHAISAMNHANGVKAARIRQGNAYSVEQRNFYSKAVPKKEQDLSTGVAAYMRTIARLAQVDDRGQVDAVMNSTNWLAQSIEPRDQVAMQLARDHWGMLVRGDTLDQHTIAEEFVSRAWTSK